MSSLAERVESEVAGVARRAKAAARVLATLPCALRDEVLSAAADLIEARGADILRANEADCEAAAADVERGSM